MVIMVSNFNKIVETGSFDEISSRSVIRKKTFLDETIRSHDLDTFEFGNLVFSNCNFIDLSFNFSLFMSGNFINCNFNNCTISKSNFYRAEITTSNFTNCKFDDVLFMT